MVQIVLVVLLFQYGIYVRATHEISHTASAQKPHVVLDSVGPDAVEGSPQSKGLHGASSPYFNYRFRH